MTSSRIADSPDFTALSALAPELATSMASIASDIALVIDSGGVIRNVAEGSGFLSSSSHGWVGQRWVDTVTPSTRRKIELLLQEVGASGISRRREVIHPVPDGDEIPVAWAVLRLGEGGPVVAVGRDLRAVAAIQQRFLEAQQEMEQAYWRRRHVDNRYRMLFQVVSDAVVVVDSDNLSVLEANDAALSLFGQLDQTLIGRRLPDCILASSRPVMEQLLTNVYSSGRGAEVQMRLTVGEGASELLATPFAADGQHHIVVRARPSDNASVAPQRAAEMAAFVETTADAVVIVDTAAHVQLANPAFVRLCRKGDEASLKGRLLTEILNDHQGQLEAMISRVRSRGVAPRTMISFSKDLSVDAAAVLFSEGDHELIGFSLRATEHAVSVIGSVSSNKDFTRSLFELSDRVGTAPLSDLLSEAARMAEKHLLTTAMGRVGGRLQLAAELLGLTPDTLLLKLRRHGLVNASQHDDTIN